MCRCSERGGAPLRHTLESVGGIPDLALMEDVALAKRLKGRLRRLEAEALTSADRYAKDGWVRRPIRNLGTLVRFWLDADVETLRRRYER